MMIVVLARRRDAPFFAREGIPVSMVMKPGQRSRTRPEQPLVDSDEIIIVWFRCIAFHHHLLG